MIFSSITKYDVKFLFNRKYEQKNKQTNRKSAKNGKFIAKEFQGSDGRTKTKHVLRTTERTYDAYSFHPAFESAYERGKFKRDAAELTMNTKQCITA